MIKANSGRSAVFTDGAIATLQIPLKLRLATKPSRLLVQVLEHKDGQYKLQCQHGRLAGRFQGRELNHIEATIGGLLGATIWTKPEKKGSKEVTIKLPAVVAKENNRGSINSAQKAGRAVKAAPKSRGKGKGKGKQAEAITIEDNNENDEAGDGDAGELVQVQKSRGKRKQMTEAETTGPRKLRKRA
jgi:hypothetical protein